jgi:hypothetical protein
MPEYSSDNFVESRTSISDSSYNETSFRIPLFLGQNGDFDGARTRSYSDIDAVAEDFAINTDEYLAALAVFSQDGSPDRLIIGVEGSRVAEQQTLTFNADFVEDNEIVLQVNNVEITQDWDTDQVTTITALAAKIQAQPLVATAAVQAGNRIILITAQKAGVPNTINNIEVSGGASQAIGVTTVTVENHGVAEDLAEIIEENNDWYALFWHETDRDHVKIAARNIEPRTKMFFTRTENESAVDPAHVNNIRYDLQELNLIRTVLFYTEIEEEFIEGAAIGENLAYPEGSRTWAHSSLRNVSTVNNMTEAKMKTATEELNINMFVPNKEGDRILYGRVISGEFIDNIIGMDWTNTRIIERISKSLFDNDKIFYTNAGVNALVAIIISVLSEGRDSGLFSSDPYDPIALDPNKTDQFYNITYKKVSEVSVNNRANRIYEGIEYRVRFASAIHMVNGIRGLIEV